MANYNIGDVVRMMRLYKGMSQEDLADGICSVKTLSRIENGGGKVKTETYFKLMERMGRFGDRVFSCCSEEDLSYLELATMIKTQVSRQHYDAARVKLALYTDRTMMTVYEKQFCMREQAVILAGLHQINHYEMYELLKQSLLFTITSCGDEPELDYPYTEQEAMIWINIANSLGRLDRKKEGITICEKIIKNLSKTYIEREIADKLIVIALNVSAKLLGELDEFEKGIAILEKAATLCKQYLYGPPQASILAELAWQLQQLHFDKPSFAEQEPQIKRYYRQAYALARQHRRRLLLQVIPKLFEECFQESI